MSKTAVKVFELLRLIEENDQLTPEDLAVLLDVHPRSIYRYFQTLANAGFPVYYSKKDEGYKLMRKPAKDYSVSELRLIKKALSAFIPLSEGKEYRLAKELVKKTDRVLPKEDKGALGEINIATTATEASYGGTITIGHSTKPSIINPILTTSSISANLMDLIFNRLITPHSREVVVPSLAERWETEDDGRIWTFYLRDDVYFHDGHPLKADDVAFTYRAILDPRNNSHYASYYKEVYRLETEGDYIFRVILKEKDALLIDKMTRPIAPKHLLKDVDLEGADFNRHPVGSGPFKFENWTDDDTITLVANENYFEKGKPFLDKLIFKRFRSSLAALSAVNKEEIDITFGLLTDIESVHPSFSIYPVPMPGYYALFFNLKEPPFSDIRVRKALSLAIDKEAIIKDQLKGYSKICTGPFDMNSWAYNPKVRPTPFDPKKAVSLLKEANFSVRDDRILDKNGEPLEIELSISQSAPEIVRKIAVAVKMHLAKIGVKLNLKKTEDESFQTTLRMINTAGDVDKIYRFWHSSSAGNLSYQNQLVDELLEKGRRTTDLQKRKEIYHEIHKLIAKDYPALFIASVNEFVCANYRIKWIENVLQTYSVFDTISDWQIAKEKGSKNRR